MHYSAKKIGMSEFRSNLSLRIRAALALAPLIVLAHACAAPSKVAFTPAASSVEAYDFEEVTIAVTNQDARNPFTDVSVTGSFSLANGSGRQWHVDGFCDSPDGSIYRIRFMPPSAGGYKYAITYRRGPFQKEYAGVSMR